MKTKIILLFVVSVLFSFYGFGQIEDYDYKCKIETPSEQWHKIIIPNTVYSKIKEDFSDIRIFSITEKGDTLETPYFIENKNDKEEIKQSDFISINNSQNEDGYFFTFEMKEVDIINKIEFKFGQKNFDWQVKLEASQNQKDWFTIIEDYRMISIRNEFTDYQFTDLLFNDSKYKYYRLFVESTENPYLLSTRIIDYSIERGNFQESSIKNISIQNVKGSNQTEIYLDLKCALPVSSIAIDVVDTIDYYRPISIKYLQDSVETDKGWVNNYRTLSNATLNSLENSDFVLDGRILDKFKIHVNNFDNQPLDIKTVSVFNGINEIVARFDNQGDHYLVYGNKSVTRPVYDIVRFRNKVDRAVVFLDLDSEQIILKKKEESVNPIFENELWLWLIIVVIIAVLGLFSIRMLKKI